MKRRDKVQAAAAGRLGSGQRLRRPSTSADLNHLLQVHPIPQSRYDVLMITMHFVHRFAAMQGKSAPELSADAASFLASRQWAVADLAVRVCRAVAANRGSLITAADLDSA